MSNESSQDRRMTELWQGQQVEGVRVTVDQIRASAGKFQRKIGWRNVREYVAALVVVIFFGFEFSRTEDLLTRIGFGLTIAGMFYMVWHIHSKGASRPLPRDVGLSSCIDFERCELERQRDLLSSVWRWYLGPIIPGLTVLFVAFCRANPGHLKHPEVVIGIYAILSAAFFVFVAKLNDRAARNLQRRIDELDKLSRQD
ncbi:MAG: hypothetical protein ABSC23_01490 [Bryobacteraceae bacterium]|jgi:hypothetical protein